MNARQQPLLPMRVAARVHVMQGETPYVVTAAQLDTDATREALTRAGHVVALLTHDAGVWWPDKRGLELAHGVLIGGGTVAFAFTDLRDAMLCKSRLEAGSH